MEKNFALKESSVDCMFGVLELLSRESGVADRKLSLGVFGKDVHSVSTIAAVTPPRQYTVLTRLHIPKYEIPRVWGLVPDAFCCISDGVTELTLLPDHRLPDYNWSGQPNGTVRISLTQLTHLSQSVRGAVDNARPVVGAGIRGNFVLQEACGVHSDEVRHCSTEIGDQRHDVFTIFLGGNGSSAIQAICESVFHASVDVTVRVTIGADDSEEEVLRRAGLVSSKDYVQEAYDINALPFQSAASISPDAFAFPVPYVELDSVMPVVSLLLANRSRLHCAVIGRCYVQWQSGSGLRSSRTLGNQFRLELTPKKLSLIVGFEQFSTNDPPVALFAANVLKMLCQSGLVAC